MSHPECRRGAIVYAVGNTSQPRRGNTHLFGERTEQSGAGHPIADGEIISVRGNLGHHPGELTARDERHRHVNLVLVGDQQHIGEVHRGRADLDPYLAGLQRGSGDVFDPNHTRRPVPRADGGPHR